MRLIKNFDSLAKNETRKTCLEIIEEGLSSIQPQKVIEENISLKNNTLTIQHQKINLHNFKRIFLLGFGKGSADLSRCIEKILGKGLKKGYVIDLEEEPKSDKSNIEFTQGTHPLPSSANFMFTKNVLANISSLKQSDLVLVVIAGGGSALFENPYKISLEKLIEVNKALLKSGANIYEMNVVRKHLSKVKGGGLAKLLYPSQIISLIASDVPGNNLSVIASGPTVKDPTTKGDAFTTLQKYNLWEKLKLSKDNFQETPKEDKYFENVSNILLVNSLNSLMAMQKKAKELGFNAIIYSDKLQGEARFVGKELIDNTPPHHILLAAGETTVKVKGKGEGGRNQELVLAALEHLGPDALIASFDSDG
jgi:glycerate-2-kinase